MKQLILFLMFSLFVTMSALAQGYNPYDHRVYELDTLIKIPYSSRIEYSFMRTETVNYALDFFKDSSVYSLYYVKVYSHLSPSGVPDTYMDSILSYGLSWGDYKIVEDKIYFQDRVSGFKMVASIEQDGFQFEKDYFPSIDVSTFTYYKNGEEDEYPTLPAFFVMFDKEKATVFRKKYNKEHRDLHEFFSGEYSMIEIDKNGTWRLNDEFPLAEGTWQRQRNVLVLNCPKLKCDFYMLIGEGELISMLIPGDLFGFRFSSPLTAE